MANQLPPLTVPPALGADTPMPSLEPSAIALFLKWSLPGDPSV